MDNLCKKDVICVKKGENFDLEAFYEPPEP